MLRYKNKFTDANKSKPPLGIAPQSFKRAWWNVDNGLPVQPSQIIPFNAKVFANGASREVHYKIKEESIDNDVVEFHDCGAWPPFDGKETDNSDIVRRVNALKVASPSSSTTSAKTDVPPPNLGAVAPQSDVGDPEDPGR